MVVYRPSKSHGCILAHHGQGWIVRLPFNADSVRRHAGRSKCGNPGRTGGARGELRRLDGREKRDTG